MHVLEVVLPVVERGVEWKRLALGRRHLLPDGHQVAGVEDAVDLGVNAVELDQVDAAIESFPLRVQLIRQLGDAGAQRQPLDRPLRGLDKAKGGTSTCSEFLAGRVRPGRRADGLAVAISQWILAEVTAGSVSHAAKTQWIATSRCSVIHARLGVGR